MKRYIKARYYTDVEDIEGKGMAYAPDGKTMYGELHHKQYEGVGIRDFRNDWLGEENFDSFKPAMDTLLDAFDIIQSKSEDKLQLRFFNIYWNGTCDLRFYIVSRLGKLQGAIQLREDGTCSIQTDSHNSRANDTVYDLHSTDPEAIADAYFTAMENKYKFAEKSANLKAKTANTMKNKYVELSNSDVDSTKLTIPVTIYVAPDRGMYTDANVPDDEEIIRKLSNCINIEDANRYMKEAVVKFTVSQVIIVFYAKIRVPALKVAWQGATTDTQFNGACRALARKAPKYFKALSEKFEN